MRLVFISLHILILLLSEATHFFDTQRLKFQEDMLGISNHHKLER